MFAIWAVAGVLSAAASGLILFRAAKAASPADVADARASLYRRQLAEIDDLADRGLLGEADRRLTHAEAARRLLAAADRPADPWTASTGRKAMLAAAITAPLVALATYLAIGSPQVPDQPFAARLATWRNGDLRTLGPAELAAVLRQVVRERPADAEGFRYLGLVEGSAGDGPAAVRALRRAVELAPQRADLWSLLGVALTYEAQGTVTPQALAAFQEAQRRDPTDAVARFHIAQAEQEQATTGDGRMDAIRGMVAGLAERLRAQPDDPQGWVRLVRAYAVLGETARRDAALGEARSRYAGRSDILDDLSEAAKAPAMERAR